MTILQDFLKDLAELVNIDAGTRNAAGVTKAAEIMKRHYESIGFHAELVDLSPDCGKALLATNRPGADHYDIMLNAHLDTVFPDGTAAARPFRFDDVKAYGPGCLDCKAGVLSIFYGIKTARKEDIDRLSILVCCNPDEELISPWSSEWLLAQGKKADRVLICEPARANGAQVRSRKGSALYTVTFHGLSAHAGNNPQEGHNANIALVRFISEIYQYNDFERGTTVNPGIIEGGKIVNAIPDLARVEIDTRFWKDEDGRWLDQKIQEAAKKVWVEGVTCELKRNSFLPAMPLSEATKGLVGIVNQAAEKAGFTAEWVDAGGGSDGNHIAESGVPVVDGCGPAGSGLHTEREYLQLDTVEERIRMQANVYSQI